MSNQNDLHPAQREIISGALLAEQLLDWCNREFQDVSDADKAHQLFQDAYYAVHFAAEPMVFEAFDEQLAYLFETGRYDSWFLYRQSA